MMHQWPTYQITHVADTEAVKEFEKVNISGPGSVRGEKLFNPQSLGVDVLQGHFSRFPPSRSLSNPRPICKTCFILKPKLKGHDQENRK